VGVTRNGVTNRSRPWDRVLQLIPILAPLGVFFVMKTLEDER